MKTIRTLSLILGLLYPLVTVAVSEGDDIGGPYYYERVDGIRWIFTKNEWDGTACISRRRWIERIVHYPGQWVSDGTDDELQQVRELDRDGNPTDRWLFGYGVYVPPHDRYFTGKEPPIPSSVVGAITIPAMLGGLPVTSFGDYAFEDCSGLTSVTIPDSVTSIGLGAFYGCSGLTNAVIGNSVTSIGDLAFYNCSGLTSITIPDSVTSIGWAAFSGCAGLYDTETIPNVCLVDGWAIGHNGESSGSLDLTGCRAIGPAAFSGCSGLTSVTIPDGVTSIGSYAFNGCSGLTSITIPDSVTSIGDSAFSGCSGLTNAVIGNSVTSIGDSAFFGCSGLTSVMIPNSVTSIGNYAFEDCSALTRVIILSDGLRFIGSYAFWNCSSLPSIYVPPVFYSIGFAFLPSATVIRIAPGERPLYVDSDRGNPSPSCLDFATPLLYDLGASVSCSVEPLVVGATTNDIAYACIGWEGTGSVPKNGTGTNVVFTIYKPSLLTWLWKPYYWFGGRVAGAFERTFPPSWRDADLVIPIPEQTKGFSVESLSGIKDVEVDLENRRLTGRAEPPRNFEIGLLDLTAGCSPESAFIGRFSFDGDADWRMAEAGGAACIESGEIDSLQSSSIRTSVVGPGRFSFDWRVSCNARGHYGQFLLDGVRQMRMSGEQAEWETIDVDIPAGTHELRWEYAKGSTSAKGEDALFLANLKWIPKIALSVSSDFGTTDPGTGTALYDYGTEITVSATAPAAADGTRRVCTGWRGTGSVPASGDDDSVSFRLERNSSIDWRWRTEHWIDVTVSGAGEIDFEPSWIEEEKADGSPNDVVIHVFPSTELYSVELSGDADDLFYNLWGDAGDTFYDRTICVPADRPRTFTIVIREEFLSLSVDSEHGTAFPGPGNRGVSMGAVVDAFVSNPAPTGGVQYVCSGWRGTGSAPPSGTSTNVSFVCREDSSLVWTWRTNCLLRIETDGPVELESNEVWAEVGSTAVLQWTPKSDGPFTIAVSGDSDGVEIARGNWAISVPADRPRTLALFFQPFDLCLALGDSSLSWTTAGDAPWIPAEDSGAPDGLAARSGSVLGDEASVLKAELFGAGILSWKALLESGGNCGIDVFLDGTLAETILDASDGWTSCSLSVPGNGRHEVRFEFWNAGSQEDADDCAKLCDFSWTGTARVAATTETTPVPVPVPWLDKTVPSLLAACGGDSESAANAIAANGRPVWECYVAGLDPNDPASDFRIGIEPDGENMILSVWPYAGTNREYSVEGKASLSDPWGECNEDSRFFRATVSLTDESAQAETEGAFPGFVTVTFDANGGTVAPDRKHYFEEGNYGLLPVPVFDSFDFLGWATLRDGGSWVLPSTPIPAKDVRLYAIWDLPFIRFDSAGGTPVPSISLPTGAAVSPPAPPARVGYSFAGWAPELPLTMPENDLTVVAQWTPNRYVVRFDANGGTGEMADREFVYGESGPLPANEFAKEDMVFAGWAEEAGGPAVHADGGIVSSLTAGSEIVLHAVWTIRRYVIRFDTNGGSAVDPIREPAGTPVAPPPDPTRPGYTFAGWLPALPQTMPREDRTVSAQWTPNRYVVRFDANGGTGEMPDQEFAYGEWGNLSSNAFSRTDFRFVGWGTDASGLVGFADGERVRNLATNGAVTLYASWDSNEFTYRIYHDEAIVVGFASEEYPTNVVIPATLNGCPVTSIGYEALKGCSRLTSVTIPDGVTSIWGSAFEGCSGLTSVTIPDSVTSIEVEAFEGCSGLTSITIPDGVTSIGGSAFEGCSGLTNAVIGNSVTSIGGGAFEGCSGLTSITIPDGVTSIKWFAFEGCSGLTSITIPDSVTSIGSYAFEGCSGLTNAVIGNSVTSIGGGAFEGCSGLTSITIPDSVTSIGSYAFDGCSEWKDTFVVISDWAAWCTNSINASLRGTRHLVVSGEEVSDVVIPNGVTSIGHGAFSGCSGLTSITIPDGVTSIGDSAFSGCSGLPSVTIPDSVTSIGYAAFSGCSGLTSVTIPNGVTSIGSRAFYGCSGLMSVTIPDSVTSIGSYAFYGCSGLTSITIPDSVTSAFSGCSGLTNAVIEISDWAAWCTNSINANLRGTRHLVVSGEEVSDVVIPNGVTSIGNRAFYGCSGLTSVTIPDSVTSIGDNAFFGCSGLASITIPDSVTSIGSCAFYACSGLTSITIPDSVTSIGGSAFYGCSGLTDTFVEISDWVAWCTNSINENLQGTRHLVVSGEEVSDVVIPNGVTNIGSYAFYGCSGLTSVTIPDSVTSIGNNAFYGCSGLTSITIPNSVTSIGSKAFYGCSGLTSITIPNSVTSIGSNAFYGCSKLNTFVEISDWAAWCTNSINANLQGTRHLVVSGEEVSDVAIPNGVTSIGSSAFSGCSGLTSITIPDSVTSIGNNAFYDCSGQTSVTIPDSVTSIGNNAFYDCSGLTSVTIPGSVATIGDSAFYHCRELETVTICEGVTSIGASAFAKGFTVGYGYKLKSLTIPDSVTSIGSDAFNNSSLKTLSLPGRFEGNTVGMGIPDGCTVTFRD